MKSFTLLAFVVAGLTTACSIKEERTVQQPTRAAVVATPPATVVYTDPAPARTTVYTTR